MRKTFVVAIGAMIAVEANKYFLTTNIFTPLIALLISGGLSVIVMYLLDSIYEISFSQWAWVRLLFDPKASFEGLWLEKVRIDERPYSLATIAFDKETRSYLYSGYAFNDKGELRAHWDTFELKFDLRQFNKCHFYGESVFLNGSRESIKNWGEITFEKDTFGKQYTRGFGVFVDIGAETFKTNFEFDRLMSNDIEKYLGKGKQTLTTQDDMCQLIKAYHKMKCT